MTPKPMKGTLLTRRHVLCAGAVGLVTLAGGTRPFTGRVFAEEHVLTQPTPALEEGPFWIEEADKRYRRSDLRANLDGSNPQKGLPLNLWLTLSQLKNGVVTPMQDAFVYIWIANALGVYSGEKEENTSADSYLRGYQVTDAKGIVQFLGTYPGWYNGRTVHVHARVRTYPDNDPARRPLTDFETQLFFDDAVTDHVTSRVAPYNQRQGRDTDNKNDRVYNGPALDDASDASTPVVRPTGDLTKVRLVEATTHANASLHMILDPTRHARPPMPPGGFGAKRPDTVGGPPPGEGGPPPGEGGPPPGEGGPPPGEGGPPPGEGGPPPGEGGPPPGEGGPPPR